MSTEIHFNPVIYQRLLGMISKGELECLPSFLGSLSNSSFRTAGYVLGERIMVEVSDDVFWNLFECLVRYSTKAFLVTCLKAMVERLRANTISIDDDRFSMLCKYLSQNEIDTQKTISNLLPEMQSVQDVRSLFKVFDMSDPSQWFPFLLKCKTIYCYFVLFSSLRYIENERHQLVKIAYYLMKCGDPMSFNLASLIKAYFGLDEIKGTFSLNLKPYELARIESSFDAFREKMNF